MNTVDQSLIELAFHGANELTNDPRETGTPLLLTKFSNKSEKILLLLIRTSHNCENRYVKFTRGPSIILMRIMIPLY